MTITRLVWDTEEQCSRIGPENDGEIVGRYQYLSMNSRNAFQSAGVAVCPPVW